MISTLDINKSATPCQQITQSALDTRHHKECTQKRGLDNQWILVNCRSVSAKEASQQLGYAAQSDGIWLQGCNHQSQYKPDKPWKSEGDKKAPKYRSPLGEYDAMLPSHPTDPYYWDDIAGLKQKAYSIDGHPCLLVTEGFFKAIAGCSNDTPTIALLGVEMGLTPKDADPQGKRYLVPTLERYAKAGFGFIIALRILPSLFGCNICFKKSIQFIWLYQCKPRQFTPNNSRFITPFDKTVYFF